MYSRDLSAIATYLRSRRARHRASLVETRPPSPRSVGGTPIRSTPTRAPPGGLTSPSRLVAVGECHPPTAHPLPHQNLTRPRSMPASSSKTPRLISEREPAQRVERAA